MFDHTQFPVKIQQGKETLGGETFKLLNHTVIRITWTDHKENYISVVVNKTTFYIHHL